MQSLAIVLLFTVGSVVYGVAQDLILFCICPEFFTLGDTGFDLAHPVAMAKALKQGFSASWWAGAILGILMALAGRGGLRPKYSWRMMLRPLVWLLGVTALFTIVAGFVGGEMKIILPEQIKVGMPAEKWSLFQACLFAHWASYFVAFMAGAMQVVAIWFSRQRFKALPSLPSTR